MSERKGDEHEPARKYWITDLQYQRGIVNIMGKTENFHFHFN